MVYEDGSVYVGNFELGLRHGKGKLILSNGASHEGDWVKNQFHGQGVTTYTDGSRHQGMVINGKKNGTVIFRSKFGFQCEEEWSLGVKIR